MVTGNNNIDNHVNNNSSSNSMDLLGTFRQLVKRAQCSEKVDHTMANASAVPRANIDDLRLVFLRYASVNDKEKGQKFMTSDDFVRKYLGLMQEPNYNRDTVAFLAGAADTTKDGLISFEEFLAFEAVLCSPDALYLTAFEMFDTNGSDNVSYPEFERIIRHTQPVMEMDFNFNCNFLKRYFGKNKDRDINYLEFTQLLHDFYEEQGVQAFSRFDPEQTGFISATDFERIMTSVKSHLLTDFVRNSLVSVSGGAVTSHRLTFEFGAVTNETAQKLLPHSSVVKLSGNSKIRSFVGSKVDILFHLAELRHPGQRSISLRDIERADPERLKRVSYIQRLTNIKLVDSPSDRGVGTQVLESAYRFSMGSVAGATGATAVYPIDLVKTRMQNQRTGSFIGEVMYKNSFDCFKKVIRHEGIRGLYSGLLPQIVGVAPEKAIKLTMNDLMRDKLTFDGHLPVWGEIIAGGTGGMCQVMFTNPLEIVKIRLQVAGEIAGGPKLSVFTVLKELGFFGLYKGARACFLRDIPFSAIYFPVYAHMKLAMADENGHVGVSALFCSALTAGVPAAALVTPADVIKTRLQVAARAGQTEYNGMVDCYRKIMAEEGPKAFWKGTVARVFRSAPQFAVTLLAYEMLQRVFYVDFGGSRPAGSEVPVHRTRMDDISENPDHLGGYKLAHATFAGIESKFGLFMPRFEIREHRPSYVGEVFGATTSTTAETAKLTLR